jgi:hypothetical protein
MNRTSRRPPFTALVLVLTAVLGHVLLWTGQPLGGFVLPVAAVGALLLRRPDPPAAGGWLVFGVAAAGALAIGYGALATPERSWDGFATWSLTARHLNDGAGLDAPYFANHSVYQAVRGYPLLQPILLQQCSHWLGTAGGRALFPALWLLLLLVVAGELRAAGVAANLRSLAVVGTALVPLFTEPGHGSAESGFADLLLAIVLTWGVGAVVRRDAPLAAAVALLLPVCKHEGGVHLALLLAVAMLAGRGRVALVMAGAGTLTLLAWLPLQAALTFVPAERRAGTVAFAAVPLVVAAATAALRWRPSRWPAVVAFAVALSRHPGGSAAARRSCRARRPQCSAAAWRRRRWCRSVLRWWCTWSGCASWASRSWCWWRPRHSRASAATNPVPRGGRWHRASPGSVAGWSSWCCSSPRCRRIGCRSTSPKGWCATSPRPRVRRGCWWGSVCTNCGSVHRLLRRPHAPPRSSHEHASQVALRARSGRGGGRRLVRDAAPR